MARSDALISPALEAAINAQIGREFGASLQYVNIATYFDGESLPELAAFFYRQAEEEKLHAMKFVHYVVEAGGQVAVPAIPAPLHDFPAAAAAVQAAVSWEMEVTRHINDLMNLAVDERDHIAQNFLQWFVAEQLEEVSTMTTLRDIIKRAGDNLLFVEDYLARQPLAAPASTGAG
jgi:ferritin